MTDIDKIEKILIDLDEYTVISGKPVLSKAIEELKNLKINVLKCFYEDEPGEKIIAIYSDGSGCEMFFKSDSLYYPVGDDTKFKHGVDKHWFIDAGYLWFINLPDAFELWSE